MPSGACRGGTVTGLTRPPLSGFLPPRRDRASLLGEVGSIGPQGSPLPGALLTAHVHCMHTLTASQTRFLPGEAHRTSLWSCYPQKSSLRDGGRKSADQSSLAF